MGRARRSSYGRGPAVRIRFPPAASLQSIGPSREIRSLSSGYRWFEYIPFQQGVGCEPDFFCGRSRDWAIRIEVIRAVEKIGSRSPRKNKFSRSITFELSISSAFHTAIAITAMHRERCRERVALPRSCGTNHRNAAVFRAPSLRTSEAGWRASWRQRATIFAPIVDAFGGEQYLAAVQAYVERSRRKKATPMRAPVPPVT
jgi:hypothetical protein